MTRQRVVSAALVTVALLLAACSGDDNGNASPSTTSGATTSTTSTTIRSTTSSTSTTQPPGTDTAAVTPILESLVDNYDTAVAAILVDSRVASNTGDAAVLAYLRLFTPSNDFPQTALQFWADEGSQGHFYRPGPRGRMYESTVQSVQADSPEQVTFVVCSLKSIVIVDEAGTELSSEGGQSAGSVVAVRVDGTWLLRDLSRTSPASCPDQQTQP
jgi:hypothetical protein